MTRAEHYRARAAEHRAKAAELRRRPSGGILAWRHEYDREADVEDGQARLCDELAQREEKPE